MIKISRKIILPILLVVSLIFYLIFILPNIHPFATFFVLTLVISVSIIFGFNLYSNLHSKLERIEKNIIRENQILNQNCFHQVEALLSLYQFIKPKYPLDKTREWAASPDFLRLIYQTVIDNKPEVIVEAGSGISTVIIAYTLEKMKANNVKIYSLDHEEKYAKKTDELIAKHKLNNRVNIYHCPIKKYHFREDDFLWYDIDEINDLNNIDLLIIDGPPALDWFDEKIEIYSRYGALPLLYTKLNDGAVILLDDAARKREKEIVERWLSVFDDLQAEYVDTEKGAYLIKKG